MVDVRVATDADRPGLFALRHDVFVVEQHVPVEMEVDEDDEAAVHVVAVVGDRVVATGRLVVDDGRGRIGRMAVARDRRGSGVGAAVLSALEAAATARGLDVVRLHAQTHALGFYERAGYVVEGDEFDDAGIAHRPMAKPLREA